MILNIVTEPIDPAASYNLIGKDRAGSVVFHYAVVKSQQGAGGLTSCIEYEDSAGTEPELAGIAAELQEKWHIEDLLLIRRVGCLGVGDIISLVAVSSPNSEDAFASCRHGITLMKKMTTIVKREIFAAV